MPAYIIQGRYTRKAIKGMIANPEDRAEEVKMLIASPKVRTKRRCQPLSWLPQPSKYELIGHEDP